MKKLLFVITLGATMGLASCSKTCTCTADTGKTISAAVAAYATAAKSDEALCTVANTAATTFKEGTCALK